MTKYLKILKPCVIQAQTHTKCLKILKLCVISARTHTECLKILKPCVIQAQTHTPQANSRRVPQFSAYPAGKLPQGTAVFGLPCGQTPAGYHSFQPTLLANSRRVPRFSAYPAGKYPQGTPLFAVPCGRWTRAGRAEKPQSFSAAASRRASQCAAAVPKAIAPIHGGSCVISAQTHTKCLIIFKLCVISTRTHTGLIILNPCVIQAQTHTEGFSDDLVKVCQ